MKIYPASILILSEVLELCVRVISVWITSFSASNFLLSEITSYQLEICSEQRLNFIFHKSQSSRLNLIFCVSSLEQFAKISLTIGWLFRSKSPMMFVVILGLVYGNWF